MSNGIRLRTVPFNIDNVEVNSTKRRAITFLPNSVRYHDRPVAFSGESIFGHDDWNNGASDPITQVTLNRLSNGRYSINVKLPDKSQRTVYSESLTQEARLTLEHEIPTLFKMRKRVPVSKVIPMMAREIARSGFKTLGKTARVVGNAARTIKREVSKPADKGKEWVKRLLSKRQKTHNTSRGGRT